MSKEGILSIMIQEHDDANVQKQIYVTELNTSTESCISQGSVVTHLRCGEKYDTSLAANLLLIPTVKKLLKSANISQSYERILYGTFLEPKVQRLCALDLVIYALDLVKHALDLVIYALDSVIYALDPVNHALHLVALRVAGSFPSSNLWTDLAVYGFNDAS